MLALPGKSRWRAGASLYLAGPLTPLCPRAAQSSQVLLEAISKAGICLYIPLIPVEGFWRRPTILTVLSGVSFYVQITWREENVLQKWVPLYSLFLSVKLYQWKSCRQKKQDNLWLIFEKSFTPFPECHLNLWWRKFSLGRWCIVVFGGDNKYPLFLMHSILLARSILLQFLAISISLLYST